MSQTISCPECNTKLGEEYIRCPKCHAFVLDSSPWRSDHNLLAVPLSILLWWGLDHVLRLEALPMHSFYQDPISRGILLLGIYGILVLLAKYRVSQRQHKAFRLIRALVSEGPLGPHTLEQARERLRGAGLSNFNHYIAYHRLQWLLSAEAADRDIRLGLLESQRQHADTDWDGLESAFASAQFLIWLLPSIGFLGTVFGISGALLEFRGVVGEGDLAFKNGLEGTVTQLATAFHTTLIGLASVIPVLALATVVRRRAQGLLEHADKFFIRLAAEQLGDPKIAVADAGVEPAAPHAKTDETEAEPELIVEPADPSVATAMAVPVPTQPPPADPDSATAPLDDEPPASRGRTSDWDAETVVASDVAEQTLDTSLEQTMDGRLDQTLAGAPEETLDTSLERTIAAPLDATLAGSAPELADLEPDDASDEPEDDGLTHVQTESPSQRS